VHGVKDVRQTDMHTAEPLVSDTNPFEVEIAIEKLKRYKLPCVDQFLSEMIQAGGNNTLCFETH
jgi:hypothetical protein